MHQVSLIGDSIRLGYEPAARAALSDVAFVWGPAENAQHSTNILLNFWSWIATRQPDVVHINCGHWDTRRVIAGRDQNIVPPEAYGQNVRQILTLAKEFTRRQVIWATITPLNEPNAMRSHARSGLAGRTADSIARYNAAAIEVARSLDVPVNDLHTFVMRNGGLATLSDDGVHFPPSMTDKLGVEVASFIRRYL